ncbi:MAG: FtsQ-type POTRA domain-containing protein [Clostridiales Family XIII bacterium]|nr:FtsQ-type POTRA domain-containing protein [Clostridiales Family XIII bacterium]
MKEGNGGGAAAPPARKRKKRRKKRYLLKAAIVLALIAGAGFFMSSSFFDIQNITVENSRHYTAEQIIEKSGAKIGVNLIWEDVGGLRDRLMSDPYIRNVKTRRALPSELVIRVSERQEEAFVSGNGSHIVIDGEGVALRRTDVAPALTEFANVKATRAEEGRPLEAEDNTSFADALNLLKAAKKNELYFKKIDISNIMVRAYIYDDLVCEGAFGHIMDNMGDLRATLEWLDAQGTDRGTIKIGEGITWQPLIDQAE